MTAFYNAQKALAAFNQRHELCGPFDDDWVEQCLAAALEDVADQADPKRNIKDISYQHQLYVDGWKDALDKVLAIAAELRGDTTTTETQQQ